MSRNSDSEWRSRVLLPTGGRKFPSCLERGICSAEANMRLELSVLAKLGGHFPKVFLIQNPPFMFSQECFPALYLLPEGSCEEPVLDPDQHLSSKTLRVYHLESWVFPKIHDIRSRLHLASNLSDQL